MSYHKTAPRTLRYDRGIGKPQILSHWKHRNQSVVSPHSAEEGKVFPNTPGGMLANLAYKLKIAKRLEITGIKSAIDKFVMIAFARAKTKSHYAKVNMYNEITAKEMTIRVFMKFLHILEPRKVVFHLEFTDRNGEVTVVSEKVDYVYSAPPDIMQTSVEENNDDDDTFTVTFQD